MNIGMIVYSQTGNTLSVAEKLREKLAAAGHHVEVERIAPVGEVRPGAKDVKLKSAPDLGKYDAVVFGSPVHGFSLAPVMHAYLRQATSVQGKRVACFVTQSFPFPWLGGRRALRQIQEACQAKGATVCGCGVVNWSRRDRQGRIAAVVDELSRCLAS